METAIAYVTIFMDVVASAAPVFVVVAAAKDHTGSEMGGGGGIGVLVVLVDTVAVMATAKPQRGWNQTQSITDKRVTLRIFIIVRVGEFFV
jgi:hypothetical protein